MKNTRRKFLRIAGLAALGWSIRPASRLMASHGSQGSEGILLSSKHGAPEQGEGLHAGRWVMLIDTKKLTPAIEKKCIETCNKHHNIPDIKTKQDIKWIWSEPLYNVFPEQMHENEPGGTERTTLVLCNHCTHPPCVRVCPTKATFQREDGIVMMDFHRCIGCRYCMAACPYGSRSFNFMDPRLHLKNPTPEFPTRTKGVVEKCEFCAERLAEGKLPYCVEVSEGAMLFGDLEDPESEVRKVLASRYSIRRKPELGTEPGVYYLI